MRGRKLLVVLGMGVLSAVLPLAIAVAPARAATDPRAAESAFVAKINALRAAKGLGALQVDGELTAIARRWASQMAAAGDISHNPDFSKWVTADWAKLGENVGMGPDVRSLHDAFVASPTHYRNLVDGDFTLVGVGVVVASDGTLFTAHQFERLAGTPAAAPAAAPRPAAAAPTPAARVVPPAPAHVLQVLDTLRGMDRPAA